MNELKSKIIMWRTELERQEATQGVMMVFDSMCSYIGERHYAHMAELSQAEYIKPIPVSTPDDVFSGFVEEITESVFSAAGAGAATVYNNFLMNNPVEILRGKSAPLHYQVNEDELDNIVTRPTYEVGDYVVRLDGELHSTKKLVGQIEWIYHEDDIGFKFNDFRLAGGLSLLFSEVRHATQEEIQLSEDENNGE